MSTHIIQFWRWKNSCDYKAIKQRGSVACLLKNIVRLPGHESQLCQLQSVWPYASYWIPMCSSFFICKMEIIVHRLLEDSRSYIQSPENNAWHKVLAIIISDKLLWIRFQGHFRKRISNLFKPTILKMGSTYCLPVCDLFVTSLQRDKQLVPG